MSCLWNFVQKHELFEVSRGKHSLRNHFQYECANKTSA